MDSSSKTTVNITGSVAANGVSVSFEWLGGAEGERPDPAFVVLRAIDSEGNRFTLRVFPDVLETAGKLMEALRRDQLLDFRGHCVEHGYHDQFPCPRCPSRPANPNDCP